MKAVVYTEPKKFIVKNVPDPVCTEQKVKIKIKSCGVCKTDIHIHNGSFISKFPLIPGHEFSGEIVEIGSLVPGFRIGQRVTADNTVLCGYCYFCRKNMPLYCENFYSLGVTGPGGFAEYIAVNHEKVFPISDDLSFDEAAFCEPAACAIHCLDRIQPQPGDDIIIFGAGPAGIILTQILKCNGAGNIIVCAPSRDKLDIIENMNIAETVLFHKNDYLRHETVIKSRFPKGFDIIIEATGSSQVAGHCFSYAKRGSKIVFYGVCDKAGEIKINPYQIFIDEIKIIGSFAQTHCFDRAIQYLESGTVKVNNLITHTFNLDEYGKAIDAVADGRCLKAIIHP
ncbi:MAG: chlorophyll synthesis pathway protein BchC [Spirochaetes bacterium GWF1_41_5]|nr:MAG: chlorophyll synthesis pathway protein BchC [Spirochaetes bacterium GWF1_41_5]